jgi:hypothetical protein
MDRLEIVVYRSNGEADFEGISQKWLFGVKIDKMLMSDDKFKALIVA